MSLAISAFTAGSYGTYNRWREWLASLVDCTPEEVWNGQKTPAAFGDLINFSDCEGTIGPASAANLARDFAQFDQQAKTTTMFVEDGWKYRQYELWRGAFNMAADGGAVDFH